MAKEIRELIGQMSQANPLWGAPRIHGELLKLGIQVSEATVSKYMPRRRKPPSQTWRSFLENHVDTLVAVDFFTVPTVFFHVLFVFVVLCHDRRRILSINVTSSPSAAWTASQIVQAFPWETASRYLLRDRDGIYGKHFRDRVRGLSIEQVIIARRSPWQNPYGERVIGSIRRECLDNIIVLNKRHLNETLASYFDYYHRWCTHLSLNMDAQEHRAVQPPGLGKVVEFPDIGGLQRHYDRRAA